MPTDGLCECVKGMTIGAVEEKIEKCFGYLARCEEKFRTTTLKKLVFRPKFDGNAWKMPSKFKNRPPKTITKILILYQVKPSGPQVHVPVNAQQIDCFDTVFSSDSFVAKHCSSANQYAFVLLRRDFRNPVTEVQNRVDNNLKFKILAV